MGKDDRSPSRGRLRVLRGRPAAGAAGLIVVAAGTVEPDILNAVAAELESCFGDPVAVHPPLSLPPGTFDPVRRQFYAPPVLAGVASLAGGGRHCLGVVAVDLYTPGLNFVFGLADPLLKAAVISLFRLRPEHYGLNADPALLLARAVTEAVHEVGHTFRLGHCPHSACVMHFSNTLEDTDRKGRGLCLECRLRLDRARREGR